MHGIHHMHSKVDCYVVVHQKVAAVHCELKVLHAFGRHRRGRVGYAGPTYGLTLSVL